MITQRRHKFSLVAFSVAALLASITIYANVAAKPSGHDEQTVGQLVQEVEQLKTFVIFDTCLVVAVVLWSGIGMYYRIQNRRQHELEEQEPV